MSAPGFEEQLLKELEAIKRLLVVSLAVRGVTQEQLAETLGASQPTVSRMMPRGLAKKPSKKSR